MPEIQAAAQNETTKPAENPFFATEGTPVVPVAQIKLASWEVCNFIVQGDARRALAGMPGGIVNTIVTSPPYYGQRDYDAAGQIGGENTAEEYISRLVVIFDEARRVLRDD